MIRDLAWSTAAGAGLPWLFRKRHQRKVLILMYHAVVEGPRPYARWTHLELESFRWQVRYLKKRFQILSLSDVVDRMTSGKSLPPSTAVLTFDDGFRNNYTTAFPVLREEGVPATVLVTTGYMDHGVLNWSDRLFLAMRSAPVGDLDLDRFGLGHHHLDTVSSRDLANDVVRRHVKALPVAEKNVLLDAVFDYADHPDRIEPEFAEDFAPLTWDDARAMASSGLVDFGAHTVSHEILSRLPREDMRREVTESCAAVRDRLNLDKITFAYPNGGREDFDDHCKVAVRAAGATCALSTIEGLCQPGDDLFELRRIGIGRDMTPARFAVMCSGMLSSLKETLGRS